MQNKYLHLFSRKSLIAILSLLSLFKFVLELVTLLLCGTTYSDIPYTLSFIDPNFDRGGNAGIGNGESQSGGVQSGSSNQQIGPKISDCNTALHRDHYYATVRKPPPTSSGQQISPQSPVRLSASGFNNFGSAVVTAALERIPEYSEDIYPYATFPMSDSEILSGNLNLGGRGSAGSMYDVETLLARSTLSSGGNGNGGGGLTKKRSSINRQKSTKLLKSESEEYDSLGSDTESGSGEQNNPNHQQHDQSHHHLNPVVTMPIQLYPHMISRCLPEIVKTNLDAKIGTLNDDEEPFQRGAVLRKDHLIVVKCDNTIAHPSKSTHLSKLVY